MPDSLTNASPTRSRSHKSVVAAVNSYKDAVATLGLRPSDTDPEVIKRIRQSPRPTMEAKKQIKVLERRYTGLARSKGRPTVDDLLNHPMAGGPMDPVARSYLSRQVDLLDSSKMTWGQLEDALATLGRFTHYTTPEMGGWTSYRSRPGSKVDEGDAVVDPEADRSSERPPRPAQVHLDHLRYTPS